MTKPLPSVEVIDFGLFLVTAAAYLEQTDGEYDPSARAAHAFSYLKRAWQIEPLARKMLEDKLENQQSWPADGLYDVSEACNQLQMLVCLDKPSSGKLRSIGLLVRKGHRKLAVMLAKMRFAPITDADFDRRRLEITLKELSAGGGR